MTERQHLPKHLSRRSWIVLAASALGGCGGGGSTTTAGAPGTGGTGSPLYAQGSISGFGSVILNGIKFDDTLASVKIDGVAMPDSTQLRLGMVAAVQGERSATVATLGTADSIEVWSIAQGVVTHVAAANAINGEFTVAGMTIQTDINTVFDGMANATGLAVDLRLVVWGLQAGPDATRWSATRVAVLPGTVTASTGLIVPSNAQFTLNGLLLTGTAAATLTAGALVRVTGTVSGNYLNLTSVRWLVLGSTHPAGEVEIEGLVTSTITSTRFMLGNSEVDASGASFSPSVFQFAVGQRVEVYGSWVNGVIKATKVELEDQQVLHEVEIEARISAYTSLSDFVLRYQRCDASNATISHGTATDVKLNAKVKVKGTKAGDVLIVTALEISSDD